jgi:hypothetical protein
MMFGQARMKSKRKQTPDLFIQVKRLNACRQLPGHQPNKTAWVSVNAF